MAVCVLSARLAICPDLALRRRPCRRAGAATDLVRCLIVHYLCIFASGMFGEAGFGSPPFGGSSTSSRRFVQKNVSDPQTPVIAIDRNLQTGALLDR